MITNWRYHIRRPPIVGLCLFLLMENAALAQSTSPFFNPNAAIRQGQDIEEGYNRARQQRPRPPSPSPWYIPGGYLSPYYTMPPQDANEQLRQLQLQQFLNQQQMDRIDHDTHQGRYQGR